MILDKIKIFLDFIDYHKTISIALFRPAGGLIMTLRSVGLSEHNSMICYDSYLIYQMCERRCHRC